MAGQFGLSPTSTLLDVKTALQNAIAQEEATISEAQQRVTHYQEQLASLAALVALPVDVPKLTDALTETKEPTAATDTSASNASAAPTAAVKPMPKRTGGQLKQRSASKTAAKTTGNRTQTVAKTAPEVAATATPVAEQAQDAPAAEPITATEPAELPKLVKAFRGKSLFEAVQMVLSGATKPLPAKEVTQKLYGKKQLEDSATSQRLTRLVTRQLIQGVSDSLFQREGDRPVLYRVASAPAPAAS